MDVYDEAVGTWGFGSQMGKAIEKCAELIVALQKGTGVIEKIADVEVACGSLRVIFGSELVDAAKEAKLARLRDLLGEEKA